MGVILPAGWLSCGPRNADRGGAWRPALVTCLSDVRRRGARHEFHQQRWKRVAAVGGRGSESSVRSAEGGNGAGRGSGEAAPTARECLVAAIPDFPARGGGGGGTVGPCGPRRAARVVRRDPAADSRPAGGPGGEGRGPGGWRERSCRGGSDHRRAGGAIGAATEWVNDVKAAISAVLASTGKQIEGLTNAQDHHDAALARLKILEEGLDKVVQALDATAKGLDQRSSELKAVKQELAGYYEDWTAEAKTSRAEMKALSKRLDAGDHMVTRLEGLQIGPWTEQTARRASGRTAAAQRDAAEQDRRRHVKQLASDGHRVPEGFRQGQGGRARGGPAGVDAHSALDGAGAGGGAGARRAVVRGGAGASWAERVRRLRALRRYWRAGRRRCGSVMASRSGTACSIPGGRGR